jgi:hypothetical protein
MSGGRLVLFGRVPTYYLRQVAQIEVMKALSHPIRIDNRVEVGTSQGGG